MPRVPFAPALGSFLSLLLSISLLCPASAWADDGPAKRAGVTPPGDPEPSAPVDAPAALPGPLDLGMQAVRPAAQMLTLKRDIPLLVYAESEATPSHTSLLPVGARGSKVPVQSVEVKSGRVEVELPNHGRFGALLRSPEGVSAIGTSGRLGMVVEVETVHIVSFESEALVGKGGRFDTMPAHSVIRYDRGTGKLGEVTALPEAPRLRALSTLAPTVGEKATMSLQATSTASQVRFAVFDEQGKPVGSETEVGESSAFSVELPGPGMFRVVARALDDSGVGGALSDSVLLRVLGVEPGTPISKGSYLVAPGERVAVLGAEGLEMYAGSPSGFVPAPSTVGLVEGERTNFLFRDPKAPQSMAVLRLDPLVARARVQLSPGMAVWPQHPIQMSVHVRGADGRLLAVGDNFDVKVRVNFDEVKLKWSEKDGGIHAVLAPQQGRGPWVVRVSVLDENGWEVGRNQLEVIRGRAPAERHSSR